jgi:MFS family permease
MAEKLEVLGYQFRNILIMKALTDLGLGFIQVFIPVYLLSLGYPLTLVMLWYIFQDVVFVAASFVSVYFSNKIGLVHCFQVRFLFLVSELLLLIYLPSYSQLFYVIPLFIGIEMAFFWIPLNTLMVRNTNHGSMGQAISQMSAYPKILTMFCPIAGAFIAVHFGFNLLFIIAMLIVLVASVPIWSLRSEKTNFIFSKKSVIKIWKDSKRFFIPEIVSSFVETGGLILSIFIYLKLLSVTQIGYMGTIAAVSSVFFTITIGKLTDEWNKYKLMKISAFTASIIWIFCFYIGTLPPNPWLFYVATFILTLNVKAFIVPYQSLLFNGARKEDAQFIVLREIPNVIGRLIIYVLAFVFASNLSYVFLFTALLFVYFWFYDSRRLVSVEVLAQ